MILPANIAISATYLIHNLYHNCQPIQQKDGTGNNMVTMAEFHNPPSYTIPVHKKKPRTWQAEFEFLIPTIRIVVDINNYNYCDAALLISVMQLLISRIRIPDISKS